MRFYYIDLIIESSIFKFLGDNIDNIEETPVPKELRNVFLSFMNLPIVWTSESLLSKNSHVWLKSYDLSLIINVSVKIYT